MAVDTLCRFVLLKYALPRAQRRREEKRRRATEALTRELGREPTEAELRAHLYGDSCQL